MKIFISWSQEPSKSLALMLRRRIRMILPDVTPWMSDIDISKGMRWAEAVGLELDRTDVGIICCTPDNLLQPWLQFEAGALSKSRKDAKLYPLCFGISVSDLPTTLSQFQATRFARDDVRKMLHEINEAAEKRLPALELEESFSALWPSMESDAEKLLEGFKLKTSVQKNNAEIDSNFQEEIKTFDKPVDNSFLLISDLGKKILQTVAINDQALGSFQLAKALKEPKIKIDHHLDELKKKNLIAMPTVIGAPKIFLTPRGKAYVVNKGLV